MQPEQQQRIMGYFIEEAKDHLNTIEQGLLNLQATIEDPELVNEVFRAAHSVKGGAAMLGLTSIQQTAHRLEDSFKVLKECSVKVDQQLESLFLRIFDTLQGLLEQLSGPFGLTEELGEQMVRELEPVFEELNGHLGGLTGISGRDLEEGNYRPIPQQDFRQDMAGMGAGPRTSSNSFVDASAGYTSRYTDSIEEDSPLHLVFDSDVPARMRAMLQAFKQPEGVQSRRLLKSICRNLKIAGEEFELPHWTVLIEAVEQAIANPENTYRTLAPTIIRDIKQAQELVLSGQEVKIAVGAKLQSLLPVEQEPETDFEDLLAFAQPRTREANQGATEDVDLYFRNITSPRAGEQMMPTISGLSIDELFDKLDSGDGNDYNSSKSTQFDNSPGFGESEIETGSFRGSTRIGPEVGAAELHTLADLFEGDSPDLDHAWEEAEDLDYGASSRMATEGMLLSDDDDSSGDFTDLLFDEYSTKNSEAKVQPPIDDLTSLFGEEFLLLEIGNSAATTSREELDFREPIAGKQPAKNNQPREFDRQSRNSHSFNDQPEEDSLGTLLDEVAAQSSTTTQNNRDLDQFLGDLGSSEFAEEELTDTSEYLPDLELDTFDRESNEPFEQNGDSQNYGWDAEAALNLLEIEDSSSLSTSGDDSDFSDLLGISSGFLTAENQPQELRNDRDPTARHPENLAIDNSLKIKLDPELEASLDPNWLESAFGLEDESNFQTNLDLDHTDLDALFGSITSDPISSDKDGKPDLKLPLTGPTSQEAADLAELFDSIPTGIEGYESEEESERSEELGKDWLNFESDAESPNVELTLQDDDLESLFSGPEVENSDEQLENLEIVELESLSSSRGPETSTAAADESSAFDFFEEMFSEIPPLATDNERTDTEDRTSPTEQFSTEHPASLIAQSSGDLTDRIQTDTMNLDEGDDDLFDALETEDAGGELENLLTELPDEQFESDLNLWSGLETGATFNSQELESFDELLDSADAQALVTSELSTGFWETDDQPEESDSAQLEGMDLSDLFDASEASSEKDEGNFDELEALLIADGSGAAIDRSEEAKTIPVSSQIFSDLEELLSERETMPEIHEQAPKTPSRTEAAAENQNDDNFDDLEKLLEDTSDDRSRQGESNIVQSGVKRRSPRAGGFGDQTMRVPVKQLDNLSNLMGELVVNRNSLEQDQERMRQFLDNLLHQVTLLSDVSQRTQDFYERSLLEIALLANRQGHRSPWRSEESSHHRESAWRPEEMDRFTPFHSLAQEIIELIVRVRESAADIEFLVDEADQVTRQLRQVTTQLQEGLTKARMKPFAETTDRLFRAVREIGIKCGKQAQLQVEGKEILIDKMIVDQLYDPMTHLVNNAITHGIEPPEVRLAAGKPAMGRITIRAFHQGNQTVISVSDDGAGIDPQKVKAKAIKQGLLTAAQAQRMSRSEVYDLLFKPGFSTQEQATEFSGRGVGMDVVLTSLQEIRGTVGTDSTIGKGTVFTIRLPLVLSISKALCCISDRARIAFPMDGVEDMIDVPRDQVTTGADGQPCIEWRGSILPFRPLRELLAYHRHLGRGSVYGFNTDDDMISVIVLRSAGNFLAVQVDQVSTEQEIVIKQLEGPVPKPLGIAGATVLGDGRIVAIADVLELIDLATGKLRKDTPGTLWDEGERAPVELIEDKTEPTVLIVDDSITVRSLLSITFEKAGYRVEEARDGKEAWEKMKSGLPCDIVFCDIEMPRMDGLELLSRMQKDPVLCELPIAMLTSRGADRHRQMAYGLGAKGYFTKPYLEEQLMDAASRMLKGEVVGAPVVV